MARRFKLDIGDGDVCPVEPEHGRMGTLKGSGRQWCAHQSHDGAPSTAPGGAKAATRSRWPYLPHRDFVEAVEAYESREAVPA